MERRRKMVCVGPKKRWGLQSRHCTSSSGGDVLADINLTVAEEDDEEEDSEGVLGRREG